MIKIDRTEKRKNEASQKAFHLMSDSHRQYFCRMGSYWQIYTLMLVGILFYVIFKLVPIWGLLVAFVEYKPRFGLFASEWVGLKYFKSFIGSQNFLNMLKNTLAISSLNLFVAFPFPIILSLALNEIRHEKFKKTVQSIIYMPHFFSWVVIAGLTFSLFSTTIGIVNKLIFALGGEPYNFLTTQKIFWFVLLFQSIWKEMGWGTIIYLAAISQVDQNLYEAAVVDGANRFRRILNVTIPSILPTVIVMFLMQIGRVLNVSFEQVWMMRNDLVHRVAETFETYTFRVGVQQGDFSVATTVGLFQSVIGVILVLFSNWLIKRTGSEGMF